MALLSRLLLGFVVLVTGALGLAFLIRPEMAAERLGMAATGPVGLSTLRGDLGGTFLALAILTAYGAVRAQAGALVAPLLVIILIIVGRGLSVLMDGSGTEAAALIAPEIAMALVLAFAHRTLMRASQTTK